MVESWNYGVEVQSLSQEKQERFMAYKQKLEAAAQQLEIILKSDQWVQQQEKEGVKSFTLKKEGGINIIKGEGVIPNKTSEQVINFVVTSATEYDENLKQNKVIEKFSDYFFVCQDVYNIPCPGCEDRTFLYVVGLYEIAGTSYLVGVDVQSPFEEQINKTVKGDLNLMGFVCKSVQNGTQLTYILDLDVKGKIPKSWINYGTKQEGLAVLKLRKKIAQKT